MFSFEVKKHNNKNATTSSPVSDFESDPSLFSSSSPSGSRNPSPFRTRVEEPEKLGIKSSKSAAVKMYAGLKKMLFLANNNGKPKNTGKGKTLLSESVIATHTRSNIIIVDDKNTSHRNGPDEIEKRIVEFNKGKYSVELPELEGVIIGEELDIIAQPPQFVARNNNNGKSFLMGLTSSREMNNDNSSTSASRSCPRSISNNFYTNQEEEEEEDDNWSDCSSDLFEIDHLALDRMPNHQFRINCQSPFTASIKTNLVF